MKNYQYEEKTLTFDPFHESNDCRPAHFNLIRTDAYRDKGEILLEVNLCNGEDTVFTLEEAQLRQLSKFLYDELKDD